MKHFKIPLKILIKEQLALHNADIDERKKYMKKDHVDNMKRGIKVEGVDSSYRKVYVFNEAM
jgi:hypothetical protein